MSESTITLAIVGGAVFGRHSETFAVTQEDGDRILAYAAAVHGLDANGNQRSPQQVVGALAEVFMRDLLRRTMVWEREQAARAASANVADIPFEKSKR